MAALVRRAWAGGFPGLVARSLLLHRVFPTRAGMAYTLLNIQSLLILLFISADEGVPPLADVGGGAGGC